MNRHSATSPKASAIESVRGRTRAGSDAALVPPYPPSWLDHLTDWVDRLPIPWWLFYILVALILCGAIAVALWQTGVYAAVGFHPMQVWLPIEAVYLVGLIHGLDRAAAASMDRFRPAFRGDAAAFAEARYRMTTLPARPTLIITIVAMLTLPFGRYEMSLIQTGGLELVPTLFFAILAILYLPSFPFFYHIWHQLREIHRLHRDRAEVRLAHIRPMHALSRVTSLTAIGIVAYNYGWFLAQPGEDPGNPVLIGETALSLAIALVVFAWPLWGAHRLLVEAKERGLADVAARKESARAQLHESVDGGKLDRVDPLHKALDALQTEAAELAKVPTWPWAAGTLRNLMGAILLPMALWLIQYGLQRILG